MENKLNSLYCIKYADTVITEDCVLYGGSKNISVPTSLLFYYAECGDRKILIDTGCNSLPGFVTKNFEDPVKLLLSLGVSPREITDVIITHAHLDHIGKAGEYGGAVIYIQKDELARGRKYIPEGFHTESFEDGITVADVFRVIKTGGHSPGSCIVRFSYGQREYVICGDECYTELCFERGVRTGCSFCPEKSEGFISDYGGDAYTRLFLHSADTVTGGAGWKKLI